MPIALTVDAVSKRYSGTTVVSEAALSLEAGRIACLLGPSGCGKSTLLRLIAGLEPVDAGTIAMNGALLSAPGNMVPPEARGIGLVFQDYGLFPHLDVSANIGFGLAALPAAERAARVRMLLARFRLEHRARAFPHALSGGEQQRAAIARALAREPRVVLMDEPFSGLDRHLRGDVRDAVLAALREAGAAVLIVTHDAEEAMLMGDDLALMAEGTILQRGTPEQCYRAPVSVTAATLLGEANILDAVAADGQARTPLGSFPAPGVADGAAQAVIRPEHVRIAGEGIPARVLEAHFTGAARIATVEACGVRLRMSTRHSLAQGDTVAVAIEPAGVHVLTLS